MTGAAIATVLVASLLLVHFSIRGRPLPSARPLDVDEDLPLPEAGQASTVFSLTALFGAYLGVYVLLGTPAILGVATGTALGLHLVRLRIRESEESRFDSFLARMLAPARGNSTVLGASLGLIQCGFATSELLILRSIATDAFGLRSDHASALAVGLLVIAYF